MNRFIPPFLFVILAFVLGAPAQKVQPQRVDQTEANLRQTIEYLASDQLEGRRTGEPGATLAANYIAKQFAAVGLRAGAKDKAGRATYLQQFPYITGVEIAKTGNEFGLTISYLGTRLHIANEAAEKPVGFSPNGAVKNAPVAFAGYGIVSKDPAFDDYSYPGETLDFKGKVVVVFDGNPDNDNPHSPYGRFDVRTKALIAKEHGAIGLIVISREDKFADERLARLGYDQSLGEAAIPTFVVSRSLGANILGVGEGELKTMEGLVGLKTTPGVHVKPGPLDKDPTVTFAVNLIKKSVAAYNVIGILPGTDPKLKNEAIVIGAHYDHLGHGGPGSGSLAPDSKDIHHGADDNASGVAAIIEIARQFKSEPGAPTSGFRNKRTFIFIAFSGEEEGLFGSNFYVNNPIFPLDKTIAMINLDMVGRLKDYKLTIGGIGTASAWKKLVEDKDPKVVEVSGSMSSDGTSSETRSAPRPAFTLQLNEEGFGPSDHSSFYSKKIPVLFFFTGTHNDYHKPTDTADKINYEGEDRVIYYIKSITESVDENPQRPTYTVAKTTMQGGRSGFNISLGTIPNYAESNDGLLLDGVRDGSPAAKAGVQAGDKVVKLAGHDIRNISDYTFVLGEMKAGEEYEMTVLRGSETLTLKIVPVKR
jgi:hypothetical protein